MEGTWVLESLCGEEIYAHQDSEDRDCVLTISLPQCLHNAGAEGELDKCLND